MKREKNRSQIIEEVKEGLLERNLPRLLMTLIILLTGLAGFLASFVMLHLGLTKMWLRYSLAILVAYVAFLFLLKIWLWLNKPRDEINFDADFSGIDFDGSGSLGSVTSNDSGLSFDFDLGDGLVLVLVLIVLVIVLSVLVYVVYIAPVLLAEILVDGLAVSSLSLRLKETDRRHWLSSAIKKTWIPLMIIIALFILAGVTLQTVHPEARSIIEWWNAK